MVSLFFIFLVGQSNVFAASDDTTTNYDYLLPTAKKYIGVPYQWGGTDPSGFDCSGYIITVFDHLGIDLPRTSAEQYKTGTNVKKEDLRIGDLVFFNTSGKGVSHAGIYIGNNDFISATSSKGISIKSVDDPYYWGPRYIGAKRIFSYDLDIGEFQDILDSYWAYEEITSLAEDEVFVGYEESYFKPEKSVTRAEVASLLSNVTVLDFSDRTKVFNDVPADHWAVGAVNALYNEGNLKRDQDGNFRPSDALTRGELAVLFTKIFKLAPAKTDIVFSDVDASHWAYEEIQSLAASGITTGYDDNTFRPDDEVKRSQFAVFLYRALN